MKTTARSRYAPPFLKRCMVTMTCFLTALTCVYAFADKPYLPVKGELLSSPGPTVETGVSIKAPVKRDEPALTRGAPSPHGIAGKRFRLRDRASSLRPVDTDQPRTIIHEDEPQHQRDVDATGTTTFKVKPTSPMSQPPADTLAKAPGDSVHKFDGPSSGWNPPDMGIAAGPNHVVTTINSGMSIHTKLGTVVQSYTTFENIIDEDDKPDNWAGNMFDPRIVYDATRQKFVVLVSGKDEANSESHFWILVSETSDPTGEWCTYYFDATVTSGNDVAWLDFAGLGVDSWGVYVTGDYKFFNGGFHASNIWTINPDIMDGCAGASNGWRFLNVQWPTGGDAKSFAPAHPHTINNDQETFFVSSHISSGDKVVLAKISGDRTSFPTLTRVEVDVPAYNAIDFNVDQPGSIADVDGKTAKVQNAVYVNRRVFFALTDDVQNNGSSSGWLTVKLDTNTNTMEWNHLLWSGEGIYYIYPAVTVQGSGVDNNIAVFGSWTDAETTISATTQFPSGVFKLYENQPINQLGRFTSVKAGEAAYSAATNRFGDYSGAAYDWTCDLAWGLVEWSDQNGNWKTTINARRFENEATCPQLEFSDPVPAQVLTSGTNHTIRWKKADLPATDEIIIYAWAEGYVDEVAVLPSTSSSFVWNVPELDTNNALLSIGSWTGTEYSAIAWTEEFTIVDATPPSPDPLSWNIEPRASGSGKIQMSAETAIDGTGGVEYQFDFQNSPNGGTGGSDSAWIDSNNYENDGLGGNYEYCYRARARDEHSNATGYSSARCAVTVANKPLPLGFNDVEDTSLVVTWDDAGNSPGTVYFVENITLGTNSGAITVLQWQDSALIPGDTYAYRMRARNADGVATNWVNLGTATTLFIDDDGDLISESLDNCTLVANPTQLDTNDDGFGNACDPDVDDNGYVNFSDYVILTSAFLSTPDSPNWNPDTDFTGDNVVNFSDLSIFPAYFLLPPGPSGLVPTN